VVNFVRTFAQRGATRRITKSRKYPKPFYFGPLRFRASGRSRQSLLGWGNRHRGCGTRKLGFAAAAVSSGESNFGTGTLCLRNRAGGLIRLPHCNCVTALKWCAIE